MRRYSWLIYLLVGVGGFLYLLNKYYYTDGNFVLGSEGSFYTDAILLIKNFGYFWYNGAVGYFATSFNYIFHLAIIQWLFKSERIVNFVNISTLYLLPFVAVYLLCIELKLKPFYAFLLATFYLTNPFTANFLKSINPWNMVASYILPAYFLIIYKFFDRPLFLFIVFGLHSLIFNYANVNPPTMVVLQVAMVFFIIVVSLIKKGSFQIREILGRYLIILSAFLLFNIWWIINWIYVLSDASATFTTSFALSWLRAAGWKVPALWRSFSLNGLLPFPRDPEFDYFSFHFGNNLGEILSLTPVFLVTISLLKARLVDLPMKFLGVFLIIVGVLAKGVNPPFGGAYEWAIRYLPLFKIFKTAPEKWGVFFTFLLILYLILLFRKLNKNLYSWFLVVVLSVYVVFSSIPFVTGNFLPDYRYNSLVIGSKHFRYKPEYFNLRKTLNDDPLTYRVLSLPGHQNYQIALRLDDSRRFYTGNDPILTNTNKPFLAPYNSLFTPDFDVLYDNIADQNYQRILGLYNIKKVVIVKDMFPWFGFRQKESFEELEEIFDTKFVSEKNYVYDLYDVGDSYLPRFYIANQVIKTDLSIEELPELFKNNNLSDRPAIFRPTSQSRIESLVISDKPRLPKLTFQKINPTKYKLKFEKVKEPFLLIFSENFHRSWNLYSSPNNGLTSQILPGGNYFNDDIKEVMADSSYFDEEAMATWFSPAIAGNRHALVNGYANSWLIKPEDVDNKENFELVLEYWPQRLFYVGAAITLVVVIASLLVLFVTIKKNKLR